MLITGKNIIHSNIFSPLSAVKNGRKLRTTIFARKKDLFGSSEPHKRLPSFPLKVPNTILARSVVAVFALGFIDAGYSGDWSRIGVITKGSEDLLKAAAFVVVPLCLFLIFSISKKFEDGKS